MKPWIREGRAGADLGQCTFGFDPPHFRAWVTERRRLFPDQLSPLTLLSAPAGYGKSIALAQWEGDLQRRGYQVFWLRLSALNADRSEFWKLMARAFSLPGDPSGLADTWQQRLSEHIVSLWQPTVLVIDDYQLITSAQLDQQLVELIELNERFSVIVSSPHFALLDGPLVTSRFPVHVISETDLAFTPEESWELAKSHGWTSEEDVRELCAAVRGWPVPLHSMLMADPFKLHPLGVEKPINLTEYQKRLLAIADDFLDRLDNTCIREVLLLIAVCPDLSIELIIDSLVPAEARNGKGLDLLRQEAASMLLSLQDLGLVLTAHSFKVQRYRSHPGLECALRARARQELGEEFLQEIQRRHAADISEEDPNRGIRLLCQLGNYAAAERVLRLNFSIPFLDDQETWTALKVIPQSVLVDYPALAGARLFLALNDPLLPETVLDDLLRIVRDAALSELSRPNAGGELRVLASLAAAEMHLGNLEDALRYACDLERRLADGRTGISDPTDIVAFGHTVIALIGLVNAEFHLAERNYQRARELSSWSGNASNEVRAWRGLGLVAIARGEVWSAERFLSEAERAATDSRPGVINREYTISAEAMVLAENGDYGAFEELLDNAGPLLPRLLTWPLLFMTEAALIRRRKGVVSAVNRLNQRHALPWVREAQCTYFTDLLGAFSADLSVMLGNHKDAKEQLDRLGLDHPAAVVAQARLELFSGSGQSTLRTVRYGEGKLHSRFRMEGDLLTALASWQLGFLEDAFAAFESAAHAMETACGYSALTYVPFALLEQLAEAAAARGGTDLREHVRDIPEPLRAAQFEPLTPAELRALEVLTDGQPLESAAQEMYVSLNTLKYHLRSIYRKLHVTSREAAVNQASRMGLV